MSLKAFHIVFVTVSTILCFGFAAWAIREYLHARGMGYLIAGLSALVVAAALVAYGRWFLRKLRGVGYL